MPDSASSYPFRMYEALDWILPQVEVWALRCYAPAPDTTRHTYSKAIHETPAYDVKPLFPSHPELDSGTCIYVWHNTVSKDNIVSPPTPINATNPHTAFPTSGNVKQVSRTQHMRPGAIAAPAPHKHFTHRCLPQPHPHVTHGLPHTATRRQKNGAGGATPNDQWATPHNPTKSLARACSGVLAQHYIRAILL